MKTKKITYSIAKKTRELVEILQLQLRNHVALLDSVTKKEQGFVTLQHDLGQLALMVGLLPQFIALQKKQVVGYLLSMNFKMQHLFPSLDHFFDEMDKLPFNGSTLGEQNFVMCGQICIAEEFRGQGIMQELYTQMKSSLSANYAGCVTEISDLNKRSLHAHEKIGFKSIYQYSDGQQTWHIVLWDWKEKADQNLVDNSSEG